MIKPITAKSIVFSNHTLVSAVSTAGTASLVLAASIAVAEPQLGTQSLEKVSATFPIEKRADLVVTNNPTVETGDAEYWEDPCGGPVLGPAVSTS